MIVGISGKAQSGKDTIGEYLVKKHGFIRIASADALKRIAMRTFNWDGEKDAKGRKFLQDLATAVRGYDPDFWINITFKEIERQNKEENNVYSATYRKDKNFVITDVRYKNEADYLMRAGAILMRIERAGIELFDHESETQLDSYENFDCRIYNNGSIEELETKTSNYLKRILSSDETQNSVEKIT
jgi:dephospho-CoA kinase